MKSRVKHMSGRTKLHQPSSRKQANCEEGRPLPLLWDVIVAGGGYVGVSLALALKNEAPELRVCVVESRTEERMEGDTRSSALTPPVCRLLARLDLWDALATKAQPITKMIITDSVLQDAVRPIFLNFEDGEREGSDPLAFMIPNGDLLSALYAQARRKGIVFRMGERVADFSTSPAFLDVFLESGALLSTTLLVAADGVRSELRMLSGIQQLVFPYQQSAIVAQLQHTQPHHSCAEEHFLPAGPFALLPLKGNRSSLVWTENTLKARSLVDGDPLLLQLELERRCGAHLGRVKMEGPARLYPLSLTLAQELVKPRFVLVGDAAHGIHPIAGQGLNLGFWDVAALAEVVVKAYRLGEDIGAEEVLERYARQRRFDTLQMAFLTDGLNRLFSNSSPLLRCLRGFGLRLIDRTPSAKAFLMQGALGKSHNKPCLLRGEAI